LTSLDEAAAALQAGGLVVLPTDTVYGVAALVDAPGAVAALFAAKGRVPTKPLPVLAEGIGSLKSVVTFDTRAEAIAHRFWPGPLTIVLPRAPGFEVDLGGGAKDSVAVRVPRNAVTLELLGRLGPLAVSSANRSDEEAAVTLEEARAALGPTVAVFVEGGTLEGRPSTIVSLMGELTLLREGGIPFAEIQGVMS
jgi:tRNA threonylcarbamoyl adenosine modification protein (Sua5/YciO/YrdC/YwlC family)